MTVSIPDLLARRNAILNAADGLPDAYRGDVLQAAWKLDGAILAAPVADSGDLETKIKIWTDLINDPASILEQHAALWGVLREDIRRLVG